jgi:rhamnulose-1-phosphate aldolase
MPETQSPLPLLGFDEIITQLGGAGRRLTEIDAAEGASGNVSVYFLGSTRPPSGFTCSEIIELPLAVPELARGQFVVTGAGSRLRDLAEAPAANLGYLEVHDGGTQATLWYAKERRFARLTSEFNSHLGVHRDQVVRHGLRFHAVVHGQPRKITYLSHLDAYEDQTVLNRRLLRWQPEGILTFPEGIAIVPFFVPGQRELMLATQRALRDCRIVVWSKHGVLARSSASILAAVDLIEYLETAAAYECLDRMLGGSAAGLSPEQMRSVSLAYGVDQKLF